MRWRGMRSFLQLLVCGRKELGKNLMVGGNAKKPRIWRRTVEVDVIVAKLKKCWLLRWS